MIEQIAGLLEYIFPARENGNEIRWAEKTIEKFIAGGLVSDAELYCANRVLEMNPEKRRIGNHPKY